MIKIRSTKVIGLLLVMVMLLSLVAGCGGGDNKTTTVEEIKIGNIFLYLGLLPLEKDRSGSP
jgi:hypothetical protein